MSKKWRPMQNIVIDPHGVPRFKKNAVVEYLLNRGPFDLNHLAVQNFSNEDQAQFAQLIGYSVSGWGDLSYVDPKLAGKADRIAQQILKKEGKR